MAFSIIAETLAGILPVFLVIFLGIVLRKLGFFPKETRSALISLVFYIGTPCLIAKNLIKTDLASAFDGKLLLYIAIIILLQIVFVWALCYPFRDRSVKGALIQLGYRGNIAIVGMPLALVLMDTEGASLMAAAMAAAVLIYNITVVPILAYYGNASQKQTFRSVLMKIIKNPLLIGVVCGILINLSVKLLMKIPYLSTLEPSAVLVRLAGQVLYKFLEYPANIASVIGLLVIGAEITTEGFRCNRGAITYAVFLRNVFSPIFILIPAVILGFRGNSLLVLAVLGSTPPAINCHAMAAKMGVSSEVTACAISASTIVSMVSVFLSVFILKISGLA